MRLKSGERAENCTIPSEDFVGHFVHFILMFSFMCSRNDCCNTGSWQTFVAEYLMCSLCNCKI